MRAIPAAAMMTAPNTHKAEAVEFDGAERTLPGFEDVSGATFSSDGDTLYLATHTTGWAVASISAADGTVLRTHMR